MTNTLELCKTYNACANNYDQYAKVQAEIGDRLFERLDYLAIQPKMILDVGCGTGFWTTRLAEYYPNATVIGVDIADGMLDVARARCQNKNVQFLKADMLALTFAPGTFDLVFSNQAFHWAPSFQIVFQALHHVMRPEACLLFSTLGPNTFSEIRQAFDSLDDSPHTLDFVDMHDVGDQLMGTHFQDPVMDMEYLTVTYDTVSDALHALRQQGVRNRHPKRQKGLMGKGVWQAFETRCEAMKSEAKCFPLTYEVIYGHAWKGNQHLGNNPSETFISADILKR